MCSRPATTTPTTCRRRRCARLIKRDFEACFAAGVDAILTPTTPSAAFAVGEKGGADPIEMYLNDVFTVTVNMAGLPGISVPGGLDATGLPLGLQLIGRPFDEETLFALGGKLEEPPADLRRSDGGEERGLLPVAVQTATAIGLSAGAAGAVVGREG